MPTGRLKWDSIGERFYETGISRGVLYPYDKDTKDFRTGVAWNGLTSVSEAPEGAEANAIYADNIKYLNLVSAEDFKGTIEAYTYPDEFKECEGSKSLHSNFAGITVGQQTRTKFCLCYTTKVGNDEDADLGYKIHIVYNCLVSPSERNYETVNDSPEAIAFSWEFATTPLTITKVEGLKPTAIVTIDSTKFTTDAEKAKLKAIEDKLFGADDASGKALTDPELLTPDEIIEILNAQ